ncbi:NADP-dependent 3-hydroxy acid dehydrogenase YdfG [Brevibacterium sanguinis]|uniref:NADP-dependent 3-hydroxy acid dehydrogenase YdfG n=2 Tax=Brevibacterium TaxID=1696 RepID=A0A366IKG8_9MICO|nr:MULTISPECIES: SDR family NAD(P)-dependent oxidoreductase [Brevibacterium]RBP65444.1 NADP-dependent 3-hydroxy acid dehydrogenase YdfG [Brevibacterium sanguinis]RBP72078.1 NADP-dependent 3-hydroxy acid dehydrogenase YdfG [Brevibacterium celere]
MTLENRTIVITGGNSGLGAACAEAVAEAGGTPVVFDREPTEAHRSVVVDVTDRRAVEEEVARLADSVDGIHGVITAAGTDVPGELTEIDAEKWEYVLGTNLLGTVSVIRALLPHLEETRGRVVTVCSTLGLRGAGGATAYAASKFGVRGFSQALAAEMAGRVGVTNLIPGGMNTRFFDGRTEQYLPADRTKLNDPRDVARSVVFALSQPPRVEVRELLIAHESEDSWP